MNRFVAAVLCVALFSMGCITPPVTNQTGAASPTPSLSELCKAGSTLTFKGKAVTVVGLEKRFGLDVCHLNHQLGELGVDYYLDAVALQKFTGRALNDTGNGCLVARAPGANSTTELCFGSQATTAQESQ